MMAITWESLGLIIKLIIYFNTLPKKFFPEELFDFLNFDTLLVALSDLLKLLSNYSLLLNAYSTQPYLAFPLFIDLESFFLYYTTYNFFNLLLKKISPFYNYTNQPTQVDTYKFTSQNLLTESNLNIRYQRNLNPIFRYDYKLGNYFTKEDSIITPYLFTTINELTGGIRKSS